MDRLILLSSLAFVAFFSPIGYSQVKGGSKAIQTAVTKNASSDSNPDSVNNPPAPPPQSDPNYDNFDYTGSNDAATMGDLASDIGAVEEAVKKSDMHAYTIAIKTFTADLKGVRGQFVQNPPPIDPDEKKRNDDSKSFFDKIFVQVQQLSKGMEHAKSCLAAIEQIEKTAHDEFGGP